MEPYWRRELVPRTGSFHCLRTPRNNFVLKEAVRRVPVACSHAVGIPYGCIVHWLHPFGDLA